MAIAFFRPRRQQGHQSVHTYRVSAKLSQTHHKSRSKTEPHRPEGQIRNKLRRRLPSRAQTGHKLPNSSSSAPHFTLYALMLSTLLFNILQTAG
jgi:hypothetical protein